MRQLILPLLLLSVCAFSCGANTDEQAPAENAVADPQGHKELPFVEILAPEGTKVISPTTEVQVLAEGFKWSEGPLWIEDGQYLLFSDLPNNRVCKLTIDGVVTDYLKPSGGTVAAGKSKEPGSNGLLLDAEGKLVLMQHEGRQVARMAAPLDAPEETYETIVGDYQGGRFNSPNDGVFDANYNLYFSDPTYGLPKGIDDPSRELDFQGVYFHDTNGNLQLIDTLTYPNGVALSPDERKLYVAVSDPKHAVWYQYDVISPGKVENKSLFYDVTDLVGQPGYKGLPDGLKVNKEGYIFATGPGGIWVFTPAAKPIARIHTGQATANCALTADNKKLYITADDYIMSVELK